MVEKSLNTDSLSASIQPWTSDSNIREVLELIGEQFDAYSVSFKSLLRSVSVVTSKLKNNIGHAPTTITTVPVCHDSSIIIRSPISLSHDQLQNAHTWAAFVKILIKPTVPSFDTFQPARRILQNAIQTLDEELPIAQYVVQSALRIVGGDVAWYAARRANGLSIIADSGFEDPHFSRNWLLNVGEGVGGRVFTHGQTVIANDYLHDKRRVKTIASMADREGIRSVLIAPVRKDGLIEGALYIMSHQVHMFHERESTFLTMIAEDFGHALENSERRMGLNHRIELIDNRLTQLTQSVEAIRAGVEVLLDGGSLKMSLDTISEISDCAIEILDSAKVATLTVGNTKLIAKSTIHVTGSDGALATIIVSSAGMDTESERALLSGISQTVRFHWANQRNNNQLHRNLVGALLHRGVENEAETLREAVQVGIDLSRPRVVVCVTSIDNIFDNKESNTSEDMSVTTVNSIERLVNEHIKAAFCIRLDGGLAIMVDVEGRDKSLIRGALQSVIMDKQVSGERLVAGIGSLCLGPTDYSTSWREARMAAQFAKYRHPPAIMEIGEVGVFSLFARANVESTIVEDLTLLLGPLKDLSPALVQTLDIYVQSGFSIESTAQILKMHPNSLRYRLKRIEDQLEIDLSHGDQRFILEFSLRARRLIIN